MKSLAYTSPYCWIFWAVFLFAYVPEFGVIARSRPAQGEKTDRGSMQLIMLAGWIGMMGAFVVAGLHAFVITRGQKAWFVAGLILLLSGSLLRRHCWRILGKHFTGDVKASPDQPVIQQGLYRWVRHPSYTGGMLMYIGTGLALTNWLSTLIIAVAGGGALTFIGCEWRSRRCKRTWVGVIRSTCGGRKDLFHFCSDRRRTAMVNPLPGSSSLIFLGALPTFLFTRSLS